MPSSCIDILFTFLAAANLIRIFESRSSSGMHIAHLWQAHCANIVQSCQIQYSSRLACCEHWLGMGVAVQWPGSLSQRHNKQANFSIELLLLLLLANKAPFALPFTAKYYVYVMCFLLHCNERTQQECMCVCLKENDRMVWCDILATALQVFFLTSHTHTHTHRDEWEWSLWQRTLDTRVHLIVFVSDGSQWPSAVGNARVSRKWKQAGNEDYEYCERKGY